MREPRRQLLVSVSPCADVRLCRCQLLLKLRGICLPLLQLRLACLVWRGLMSHVGTLGREGSAAVARGGVGTAGWAGRSRRSSSPIGSVHRPD